ncbi:MAG TPA: hypothetical protein VFC84_02020 [Desulfosporosinus sp.]|nr:hypothetical protein [Desulfosporosinus sp.]
MDEETRLLLKKEKDAKIKKEILKLKRLFKNMEKSTMDTVSSLIRNAAFMAVTLDDLQETINLEGAVSEYKNGENQFGTKKSPEVEIYTSMIEKYMKAIKQLSDLLPKQEQKPKSDGFNEFVSGREDVD